MSIEILPYTKLLSTFSKFSIIPIFFLTTRELPLKKNTHTHFLLLYIHILCNLILTLTFIVILSDLLLFGLVSSAYSISRGRKLKEVVLDHSTGEYSH